MPFLNTFWNFLPGNITGNLYHLSHSADYEYADGRHSKPCRACTDFQSWVHSSKNPPNSGKNIPSSVSKTSSKLSKKECPLDKDELGRNSWSLFHTMAAYYPEKPTQEDQTSMKSFIDAVSRFYPCDVCAKDFREDIKNNPPKTSSRDELSLWWCGAHNRVNKKLGKPEFDCSKLDQRWLDGWSDGSCDS